MSPPSSSRPRVHPRLACTARGACVAVALLSACDDRALPPCAHDEGVDATIGDMARRTVVLPPVCRRIFVVDGGGLQIPAATLSSFDPETNRFEDLGVLACPSSAQPFSMAVARDNTAFVLYGSGELFRVDLDTLKCSATALVPGAQEFQTFGMGFSSDAPGGDAETLFIASGPGAASGAPGLLGTVDLATLRPRPLGTLAQMASPELTGTGQAELWGFTPNVAVPSVSQIDKRTAAFGSTFRLPSLRSTGFAPRAWAFAFWGGSFFLFLERAADQDSATKVYKLGRATGELGIVVSTAGRRIVGAGVSSCAPLGLDL